MLMIYLNVTNLAFHDETCEYLKEPSHIMHHEGETFVCKNDIGPDEELRRL